MRANRILATGLLAGGIANIAIWAAWLLLIVMTPLHAWALTDDGNLLVVCILGALFAGAFAALVGVAVVLTQLTHKKA